ncbi:MAG: aldose 1-epimerase [Solirubrobacteraceae bacterium]|nr:aldose 1-epimerase [Solirubrobacteraceae bacterium]
MGPITDLTPITLTAGDLTATFVPGAGMVGSSLTHRGVELLGQRGGLDAYVEKGSTFGIPLLYPWANRLSDTTYGDVDLAGVPRVRLDPNGLPIHGLLHAWPHWEVADTTTDRLRARTDLEDLPGFPFPHILELDIALTETTLAITTRVHATGDVPVPISFGFHPYFAVTEDTVLTTPAMTHIALDDRGIPTDTKATEPARSAPLGTHPLDDLYEQLPPQPTFELNATTITFDHGYPIAQLYRPENQPLLAIEPMTAPTDALRTGEHPTVPPGETFTATFSIGRTMPT